ncbi:MAG: hypothetical protein LAP61_23190 [Acidobacteriia bacterium]|nr:hypothetical protein [Terriglobia bacterium]
MPFRITSPWMFLLPFVTSAADIPCQLTSYHVVTDKRVAIDCTQSVNTFASTVSIFIVTNGNATGESVSSGTVSTAEFKFLIVDLGTPLKGNTDYEMRISGSAGGTPFDTAYFRFSTKPNATIAPPIRQTPTSYRYGGELWLGSPVEFDLSTTKQLDFASEDAPGIFVSHHATVYPQARPADVSVSDYGTLRLTFDEQDESKQLNSRFKLTGLKTIFGDQVVIKLKKRLAPASSPKGKDDSIFYANFLSQAGVNSKPVFILNGKVAPVFGIRSWKDIQFRPTATADVGQGGAIGKVKTNDIIQLGPGFGRFIRTEKWGAIQGIDPTIGFIYETNYALIHKNALFASETQWFAAGTDNSLKQQNFLRYLKEKTTSAQLEPQDATKAFFGYRSRFYTGVEAGSQISDETAKASVGTSKITVPGYSISRIYPKVSLSLEFSRFVTLNLSGTARYLFATEQVYRERDGFDATGAATKIIYGTTVQGWRPSGEVDLSIALDDAGHYALTSTLKLGSLPPNFERVVVVQNGITIKF